MCEHIRDPVKVGSRVVLLSGLYTEFKPPHPGFAIFLDEAWGQLRVPYNHLTVAWPDFGVLTLPDFRRLVAFARAKMEATILEIACLGGCGRTDTLLAGLIANVEDVDADTAIKLARQRHCKNGIETEAQEELVRRFKSP